MDTVISFIAQYLLFVAALITFVFWLRLPNADKASFAIRFAIAGIIAFLLAKAIGHFYFDTRPFVRMHETPLFPHAADNGFPSDHTLVAMLAALVTALYSRKVGGILIICALLIGIARIAALVHSPIDILGSIVIAAVSVWIARLVQRRGNFKGSHA